MIRYAKNSDIDFWLSLDLHIDIEELQNLIALNRTYIICDNNVDVGILRYNLFRDEIPFINLIYIKDEYQNKGYGKKLIEYFEKDISNKGYKLIITSTRTDEDSQYFYRRLNYLDGGYLDIPLLNQDKELFLYKEI